MLSQQAFNFPRGLPVWMVLLILAGAVLAGIIIFILTANNNKSNRK